MPKFIPKQDVTVNATAATNNETDNCELGVSGSAARTSPGAGAMRPSAILRIMSP